MSAHRYLAVFCLAAVVLVTGGCKRASTKQSSDFQPVESSLIDRVKYDAGALTIAFDSGETYEYKGVPESVYTGFLAAESKGEFFQSQIKGKFEFTKK